MSLSVVMADLIAARATREPAAMAAAIDGLLGALESRTLQLVPITRVAAEDVPAAFRGRGIVLTHPGRCRVCKLRLEAGDSALWAPNHGVAHVRCGAEARAK